MKRIFLILIMAALLCGSACADDAGYWTTREDAFYHIDAACGDAIQMYPISKESAESFEKLPCKICVDTAWKPYFTGQFINWPYEIDPWSAEYDQCPDEAIRQERMMLSTNGSTEKLNAAFKKYGVQDDYCGCYYSVSGDLVIAIKSPTLERAELYARNCGGDIWVVEAQFSERELEAAQQQLYDLMEEYNAANEYGVRLVYSGYGGSRDYVGAYINGSGVVDFVKAAEDILHPAVKLSYPNIDPAEDTGKLLRAPQTVFENDEMVIGVYRPSYPVGTQGIDLMLEVKEGALQNYLFEFMLYKYADAQALEDVLSKDPDISLIYEGDGAFVELPCDWIGEKAGTVVKKEVYPLALDFVKPLGEGFYKLYTGGAFVEFAVSADAVYEAPQLDDPAPDINVLPHPLSCADEENYSSFADLNISKGSALAENRILVSDRIYYLHQLDYDNVEDPRRVNMILTAPVNDLQDAAMVYGPTENEITNLIDLGDSLLFVESQTADGENTIRLIRLSYDGSTSEMVAERNSYIHYAMMVGDMLYYNDDHRIYRYSFEKDKQETLIKTDMNITGPFSYVDGKITYFADDLSDASRSRLVSYDVQTGKTALLKAGRHFFHVIADDKLYTSEELGLDLLNAQLFKEGIYGKYYTDTGMRKAVLICLDGTRIENLPKDLFQLGGVLYSQDVHGNICRENSAILAG